MVRRFFRQPVDDVLAALERTVAVKSALRALGPLMLSLILAWFIYVPIHELLHVLGCVATGGEVSRLEVAPQYGGALLAKVFPFVESGGDYAGRLSGFDWKGSDVIYLVTDFMPYVLTVLLGIPLIKACGRRRRPILFGVGVVVGLAPFYNLPGDYYEMGSIVTTRAVTVLGAEPEVDPTDATASEKTPSPENADVAFAKLRGDDVFKMVTEIFSKPAELGLEGRADKTVALVIVFSSLVGAVLLAFLTYWLGHLFSGLFPALRAVPAARNA